MRRGHHPFATVGFAVVIAATAFIAFAPAAGAVTNNCASPGGVSEFPNTPAGQSNLQVSCVLTTTTGASSQFYNTEDFPQAVWHVGAGRIVTGSTTSGSKTITLSAGAFTAADINHGISGYSASTPLDLTLAGSDLPAGTFIVSVASATSATLNAAATATGSAKKWTIENSDSRAVADGHVTSASTTVTSATAHFCKTGLAGCGAANNDVGRTITGTDIPHGTKISAVTNTTTITISHAASSTSTTEGLTIGPAANQTTARFVHDAHTTSASTTVTSASASFQSWDVNLPVVGTDIPAGAHIVSVTSATTIVISAAATAATTTGSLTIGGPSATAPKNGDTAMNLGAELDLNPALVAGSDPCTANTPEGFSITGAWQNPGSYIATSFGSSTDASLKHPTIVQFAVPTAVVTFAGYVEQMPASSGDTDTAAHYDLVFPFLPTGLAVCSTGTAGIASTFEFVGTAHSQSTLPTGVGTPSTAQARALKDITTASVSSSAVVHIRTNSSATSDNFTFTGACTETFPDVAGFGCGIG
jgi:hypothetical protein